MEAIKLIKDYQLVVEKLLNLLKKRAIDFGGYKEERAGILDAEKNITFSFHGIGCLFMNNNTIVDIDFGRSRYDGIDLWFLEKFWETSKENYSYTTFDEIITDIEALLNKGELIKDKGYKYLYYFKSDYENPKEFSWN